MKTRHLIAAMVALLIASATDLTAQSRIGMVNPQEILNALPEKAVIERRIRDYQSELQTELENRARTLQQNVNSYESRKNLMTQPQQREEEQRLGRLSQQIQQFERSIPELLQRRQAELMQPIITEMNGLIERYSKELNLDYVLNEQLALNQFPMIFIANPTATPYDLTSRILEQLKK